MTLDFDPHLKNVDLFSDLHNLIFLLFHFKCLGLCTQINITYDFVYLQNKNIITYTPKHISTNRNINRKILLINFANFKRIFILKPKVYFRTTIKLKRRDISLEILIRNRETKPYQTEKMKSKLN